MADPISNDPRNPAPTASTGRTATPPRTGAAQPTNQPASQPQAQGLDAANSALDQLRDTHMRNSPLSQRTDLYNEADTHIRALRELFATAHGTSGASGARQQTAENQDAFQAGSNNANV